jgi:hypothetical protein
MTPRPASGSIAAHDELAWALEALDLAEASWARTNSDADARTADQAYALLLRHAVNCGKSLTDGVSTLEWARRRVETYRATVAVGEQTMRQVA